MPHCTYGDSLHSLVHGQLVSGGSVIATEVVHMVFMGKVYVAKMDS